MTITSSIGLVAVSVHIRMEGAPEVEDNHRHRGQRFVPAVACWSAGQYGTGVQLRDSIEGWLVAACSDGGYEPPVPEWVPRPPDGWDAVVVAYRQTLAERAAVIKCGRDDAEEDSRREAEAVQS